VLRERITPTSGVYQKVAIIGTMKAMDNPITCSTCDSWCPIYSSDRQAICRKMPMGIGPVSLGYHQTHRDFGCIHHPEFPKLLELQRLA